MKAIKKVIILLVICMIIILIILLNSNNESNFTENGTVYGDDISQDDTDITFESTNFEKVKYNSEYYSILNIINEFCDNAKICYSEEYRIQSMPLEPELLEEDAETYYSILSDMLSKQYIEQYSITNNSLEQHISELEQGDYNINSMYVSNIDNYYSYLIYGEVMQNEYNFLINVDMINNVYEIYLNDYIVSNNYTEENIVNIDIQTNNIELNDNNSYTTLDISQETMARNYFNDYIDKIRNNQEEAYELLNSEYREKRFGSYNEFEEYYNANREYIEFSPLSKYSVTNNEESTQYICIDGNNNYYIFNVTAVMEYNVLLDYYTIEQDRFIEAYQNASNEQKVYSNIDKFIAMINNKDYNAAYGVLDETFKQNNFPTIGDFENYINQNYFSRNTINSQVNLSTSGEYYICTINVNNEEETQSLEKSFIMQLGEGTDFKLSFDVSE